MCNGIPFSVEPRPLDQQVGALPSALRGSYYTVENELINLVGYVERLRRIDTLTCSFVPFLRKQLAWLPVCYTG